MSHKREHPFPDAAGLGLPADCGSCVGLCCVAMPFAARLARRPLEYDALTGAVVRAADHHGIDVPANRFVLALPAAIEPEIETEAAA